MIAKELQVKHTPAPWIVAPMEADKEYIRIRGTKLGGRFKVANVLDEKHNWSNSIIEAREKDESLANARLISAAPDLLEAHKQTLALVTGFDVQGALEPIKPFSWETIARLAIDYSVAAIAKAEGGQA